MAERPFSILLQLITLAEALKITGLTSTKAKNSARKALQ
jgi:hypothetical protein